MSGSVFKLMENWPQNAELASVRGSETIYESYSEDCTDRVLVGAARRSTGLLFFPRKNCGKHARFITGL